VTIEVVWYALVAGALAVYVVLDGFDLGAGALHLVVARTDRERSACLRSIGPVWDGNEVWLIAAAGTLLFAFPRLYATSFSGFYLPLIMVLWLLVFRALAIELRDHVDNAVWRPFWDTAFAGASLLLAFVFGVALGNVVRGVPLDADGRFFAPLWTDLRVGDAPGVLDWYTVLVGATAACALSLHGALWLGFRVDGAVGERARRFAWGLWLATAAATVAVTAATLVVQPRVLDNLGARPWGAVFPALALGGLGAVAMLLRRGRVRAAFAGSATYLIGMLGSAAFGIFPYVLPARDPERGLTLYAAASGAHGLRVALWWWVPGVALAAGYAIYLYRRLDPVSVDDPASEH